MEELSEINHRAIRAAIIFLGCMGVIGTMCLDYFYWRRGLLMEGLPESSPIWLLRSAVIFLSLVIIAFSVTYGLRRQVILFEVPGVTLERSFVLGTLGISCLVSLLFLINPAVFSALSLEDGPVEWGSAVLLFFSSAVCSLCYAKVRKLVSVSMVTKLTLVLLALVFFVIAMEEISWFQRI
jgi:hypothetical protein